MQNSKLKKTVIIVTIILGIFFLMEVIFTKGFYEYTRNDLDLRRLPLIEPSEIYSLHASEPWLIMENSNVNFNGVDISKYNQLEVESIGLLNNLVIFNIKGQFSNYWLVYDSQSKIGHKFDSEGALENAIKCKNLELKNPEDVFKEFSKKPTEHTLKSLLKINCLKTTK